MVGKDKDSQMQFFVRDLSCADRQLSSLSLSLSLSADTVSLSLTLAVFISVTHAAALYSSMDELTETSGDELQDVDIKSPPTEKQKWHLMAQKLLKDVKTLRDEQFEKEFKEMVNMTSFEGVKISTPHLKATDGCLSRNFSTERCLGRIYSVLTWYKNHMSYIERENLTSSLMNDAKYGTKRLLGSINIQLQKRNIQVEGISSPPLPVGSTWTRKTAVHSILINFTNVMTVTCRAINYIQRNEDRKRPSEFVSKKN
ncbi:interleukin-6-like [Xyrauchen texanus]|uniref:interleukin-6-like n=1 Tax=Xyrauchen texanus TaxID=154827 RepID=UPI00224234B4|nr:interleukin-6-like [Xyrauchen texanus]